MGERFSNRVLKQGRVTIPAHIRNRIGVEPGDYVIVEVSPMDGDED